MTDGFILTTGAIAVSPISTFYASEKPDDVLTDGWVVVEAHYSGGARLLLKGLSQQQAEATAKALQESERHA